MQPQKLLLLAAAVAAAFAARGARAANDAAKPTLAVLPFVGKAGHDKTLARHMRFAVDRKLNRQHTYRRISWEHLANIVSVLPFSWNIHTTQSQVNEVAGLVNASDTVMGFVHGHQLKLELFHHKTLAKTLTGTIPPGTTSPKLFLEHILTRLVHAKFKHIRTWQVDRKNPLLQKLFKTRPNLVPDGTFSAPRRPGQKDRNWQVILMKQMVAPKFLTAAQAANLPHNEAAIVPQSFVGLGKGKGNCLMMRVGFNISQGNGLACESMWIPVKSGEHYRFSVQYHSAGPRVRIFLKGFAPIPDQFSKSSNPASWRIEAYRAQLLPLTANKKWQTTAMDFTPQALHPQKHQIKWLRIDFFIYLSGGDVFFRDAVLKNITPHGKAG